MNYLDAKSLLDASRIFSEFNGTLTEKYVLQQLVAGGKVKPFYWSAEASTDTYRVYERWCADTTQVLV